MRILIAPMAAVAETSGSSSRVTALCHKLLEKGHKPAFCAANDRNYRRVENVKNYYTPIPSPYGTPLFLGKNMFKLAQLLGIQQRKKVNSFEEVLHFLGIINRRYFPRDVFYLRKAIQDFKPDAVFAEFRITAIVAAVLENIKVAASYSYPLQKSYASNPEYSRKIRVFFKDSGLPDVESVLDVFNWADLKIVPSSYELEPIDDKNVIFTGPFQNQKTDYSNISKNSLKNKILAYMGNGTITPKTVVHELTSAFKDSKYQVYIATDQISPYKKNNINVDKRFDFNEMMPTASVYINHGGQNSIMAGLIYGVPQIICAGNVSERKYNSDSIVRLKAGVSLGKSNFNSETLQKMVGNFENEPFYAENARTAGEKLLSLGGTEKAVRAIESMIK